MGFFSLQSWVSCKDEDKHYNKTPNYHQKPLTTPKTSQHKNQKVVYPKVE